jgi:hypothetical protein
MNINNTGTETEFTIDVCTLMRLIKSEDPELYVLPSVTEVHRTDAELLLDRRQNN